MRNNPRISDASLGLLLSWMNTNLFRSPLGAFPRDVVASNGRPVYDVVEVWAALVFLFWL